MVLTMVGFRFVVLKTKFVFFFKTHVRSQFTAVKIPRENMLMKWTQVHPDGTYSLAPIAAAAYLPLIGERLQIVPIFFFFGVISFQDSRFNCRR